MASSSCDVCILDAGLQSLVADKAIDSWPPGTTCSLDVSQSVEGRTAKEIVLALHDRHKAALESSGELELGDDSDDSDSDAEPELVGDVTTDSLPFHVWREQGRDGDFDLVRYACGPEIPAGATGLATCGMSVWRWCSGSSCEIYILE